MSAKTPLQFLAVNDFFLPQYLCFSAEFSAIWQQCVSEWIRKIGNLAAWNCPYHVVGKLLLRMLQAASGEPYLEDFRYVAYRAVRYLCPLCTVWAEYWNREQYTITQPPLPPEINHDHISMLCTPTCLCFPI
jgi:hypothetical protein